MQRWLCALWILVYPLSVAMGDVEVRRGDYEARLGANGLEVRYRGVPVVSGSRFTLFKPGYAGAYFSQADFTGLTTQVKDDRITVTGRITEIDAQFTHRTVVDKDGVEVLFTLQLGRPMESSPVELALLMFPPEEFAGGSYRVDSLYGQARPQPLPLEKPKTSAAGTQLIASSVRGITLYGRRVALAVENLGEVAPSFFDMRSRDFPQPERVYWLLYQWAATSGETTCGVGCRQVPSRNLPGRPAKRVGSRWWKEAGVWRFSTFSCIRRLIRLKKPRRVSCSVTCAR